MIGPEVGGQYFAPGSGAVVELDRPPADRSTQPRRANWYRQPALMAGLVITGIIVGLAIAAPLLTSYNPIVQNLNDTLQRPSAHHLLGTDQLGRDTFTRLLYGARVDLRVG